MSTSLPVQKLPLSWKGPFAFVPGIDNVGCVFDAPVAHSTGVYVWTFPFAGSFLPYYVGETGASFAARLKQELNRFHDGREWILDPVQLDVGVKSFLYKAPNSKTANREEFSRRQPELRLAIEYMLQRLRIFVAPVDEALRVLVERKLMWDAWNQGGRCRQFICNEASSYGAFPANLTLEHRAPATIWGVTESLPPEHSSPEVGAAATQSTVAPSQVAGAIAHEFSGSICWMGVRDGETSARPFEGTLRSARLSANGSLRIEYGYLESGKKWSGQVELTPTVADANYFTGTGRSQSDRDPAKHNIVQNAECRLERNGVKLLLVGTKWFEDVRKDHRRRQNTWTWKATLCPRFPLS